MNATNFNCERNIQAALKTAGGLEVAFLTRGRKLVDGCDHGLGGGCRRVAVARGVVGTLRHTPDLDDPVLEVQGKALAALVTQLSHGA